MEVEIVVSDEYGELEYAVVDAVSGRRFLYPYWSCCEKQHKPIVDFLVSMCWYPSQKNLQELPWLKELWEKEYRK